MTKWLDRRIAAPGPHLALCLSEAEFKAALKQCKVFEDLPFLASGHANASATWVETPKGELVVMVSLSAWEGRNPIEVAGLLIHEAVHVWQKYAERIGEKTPGIEQEAYAIQAISQELLAEFARRMAA